MKLTPEEIEIAKLLLGQGYTPEDLTTIPLYDQGLDLED